MMSFGGHSPILSLVGGLLCRNWWAEVVQRLAVLVASGWLALASQVVDVVGLASVGWQALAFETSATQGVESAQSGWLEVGFLQSCL